MQKFTNRASTVPAGGSISLYSPPENADATIHNLLITNSNTSNSALISIKVTKTDNGDLTTPGPFNLIPENYELKIQSTLEMKPINLIFGDVLIISSNAAVDVWASILEEIRDF